MTLEAEASGAVDPWRSPDRLAQEYASPELVAGLAEVSGAAGLSGLASGSSHYVNTADSADQPFSRWLRYREGYSPRLVLNLMERFPPDPGTSVLDPMCGSGSSLLAAQAANRRSIGIDVSPYAVLASRVKTRPLDEEETDAIQQWMGSLTSRALAPARRFQPTTNQEALASYFPAGNFRALCAIDRLVGEQWPQGPQRELLELGLLAILEDCSDRRKDGNGLASRPSKVLDPLALFKSRIGLMLDDIRGAVDDRPLASCLEGSAVHLDDLVAAAPADSQVGVVVFSPPYPNSFDYFESYKLELLFTGRVPIAEFQSRRRDLIRSFRQSGSSVERQGLRMVELLIGEIQAGLARKEAFTGSRDARTRLVPNLLRGYFEDMRDVLVSCAQVLSPGARMHIVVDQSAYAGVPVPTDLLLAELGSRNGFEFDQLTVCRRSRTSGQQLRLNPALGGLLRESVITLRRA